MPVIKRRKPRRVKPEQKDFEPFELRLMATCGGQSRSKFHNEKNTCTVRAISTFLELPYDDVRRTLLKAGRKGGHGATEDIYLPFLQSHGAENVAHGCKDLREFLTTYQEGTFFVQVPGHVFVIKNGVIWDDHFNKWYLASKISVHMIVDEAPQGKVVTRKIRTQL